MNKFTANSWEQGTDQNFRPCWINRQTGEVAYQLLDGNGIPLPQNYGGHCGSGMPQMWACAYPMPMMGMWGMTSFCPPSAAPTAGPSGGPIAIVGGPVKPDEWKEYEDDDGNKYYHNPRKPDETTWEKPDGFDEQQNAGNPPPPTEPKPKGPKYTPARSCGWLP
eukprot:g2849.t1